jgi:hypothetical protein
MGIKENIIVQVKDRPALNYLGIADMSGIPMAPMILGRLFLRTVKSLINLHEWNVIFELPSHAPFFCSFS